MTDEMRPRPGYGEMLYQQEMGGRSGAAAPPLAPRRPYSEAKRVGYGLLWAGWTAVLLIAGFAGLFSGQVFAGLMGFALAALAGRYDYRIWTWQARRLLFLIIF